MKEKNWLDYPDAVSDLSLSKGEPDWMRTSRQDALAKTGELSLPHIDRVKFHRWSLFDVKETQTISETGTIPASGVMKNNPVLVQQGSWTIFEQLPAKLAEKGVIFTDLFTAMIEYPKPVQRYYMKKTVNMSEDQLTVLHVVFMNSDTFLYVPRNIVIDEPLESLFIQDGASDEHLSKHVLIVTDEHSEFPCLERFQTTKKQIAKSSGSIIVEVIAKAGSKIKYSAVDQLGKSTTSYMSRRGYILRDAFVDWVIDVMNDGHVIADFDSNLAGEDVYAEVRIVIISSGRQI